MRRNLSTGGFHNIVILLPSFTNTEREREREREGKKRENDENVSKKCGASKFR